MKNQKIGDWKMNTPEYVLEIRDGLYTDDDAVNHILQECNMTHFPINVWNIARKMNFEVFEACFKEKSLSGMMIDALDVPKVLEQFDCKRAIILNRDNEKSVQSFTIAHELAYFIYECNDETNCFDAYHISRSKDTNVLTPKEQTQKAIEDKMDKFAAMLLMPEVLFVEYLEKSTNRHDKRKLTKELARVCMVEEDAVEKRFKELKISFY